MGTPRCTWGEFRAYIGHLPPGAALWRVLDSPRQWGWVEHLLAAIEARSSQGNWQRGGGKGQRPKPMKPPGKANQQQFGTAVSVDEMRAVLDAWDDPEGEVTDGD